MRSEPAVAFFVDRSLVPRPQLHLIRFGVRITSLCEVSGPPLRDYGVLAPNAKLRALVVTRAPEEATGESALTATESGCTYARPARINSARLLKRVLAAT